jgi:excisionase family DNA binding protein
MKAEFDLDINELAAEITQKVLNELRPLLHVKQDQDEILDVPALAAYLKVSVKWIYERTHLKEIPHIKAGGQLRFRKKVIDRWLDSYGIPVINRSTAVKSILQNT